MGCVCCQAQMAKMEATVTEHVLAQLNKIIAPMEARIAALEARKP